MKRLSSGLYMYARDGYRLLGTINTSFENKIAAAQIMLKSGYRHYFVLFHRDTGALLKMKLLFTVLHLHETIIYK